MSRFWKITGYDGGGFLYERKIPLGTIDKPKMTTLLQRLAARHLDFDEVIDSSLRKSAEGRPSHFEVREISGRKRGLETLGTDHYYTATIQEGDDA